MNGAWIFSPRWPYSNRLIIVENSGGIILEGVCFYNMHAREIGEANGWKRLMSNSAKISNILGGYGYETILSTMEKCVDSACQGKIVK